MARGYSSLKDSDDGICSDEVAPAGVSATSPSASGGGHRDRDISRSNRSRQSVYNDYYDTNPTNLVQLRYMEKIKQIQLIHALLQSCSFASSTFEIYVKIIFPNHLNAGGTSSSANDGLSISLRRALGRLDSSAGSITAGGHVQTHIRKVKVQCANVPEWSVENVELPSEALATLKLQCLRVTTRASTHSSGTHAGTSARTFCENSIGWTSARQAWTLLNHMHEDAL
jgi:hypothetical protein